MRTGAGKIITPCTPREEYAGACVDDDDERKGKKKPGRFPRLVSSLASDPASTFCISLSLSRISQERSVRGARTRPFSEREREREREGHPFRVDNSNLVKRKSFWRTREQASSLRA